ncbi:MAG TPA: DUF4388 domain-containing protein [Syntrophobacteraceae bacterium]|nr:DUF4388 domain-containing protein [Syntrophobacteraceae bacterium]
MEVEQTPGPGFSGTVEGIALTELVQLLCLARLDQCVAVRVGEVSGQIAVAAGQVVHAVLGEVQGEEAVYELLGCGHGSFETKPLEEQPVQSVSKGWEYLLVESVHRRRKAGAGTGPEHAPGRGGFEPEGFRGLLRGIQLVDLIQLICSSGVDCRVEVEAGSKKGTLLIRSAQVCQALTEDLTGEEAFYRILSWRDGRFQMSAGPQEVEKVVRKPWEHLLVEAMRLRDESPPGDASEGPQTPESLVQRVGKMKVNDKVRLAMMGDKECRSLLMRDPNRLVQAAIIGNPRITDGEIAAFANSRNVDDEVLRKIASNREWVKSYAIRMALVTNPKTPLPIAIKLVPTLTQQDLKQLAKSKTVPIGVAQAARRITFQKE